MMVVKHLNLFILSLKGYNLHYVLNRKNSLCRFLTVKSRKQSSRMNLGLICHGSLSCGRSDTGKIFCKENKNVITYIHLITFTQFLILGDLKRALWGLHAHEVWKMYFLQQRTKECILWVFSWILYLHVWQKVDFLQYSVYRWIVYLDYEDLFNLYIGFPYPWFHNS